MKKKCRDNIEKMNINELLNAYAEFSKLHGESTETGDFRGANKAHDSLQKIYKRIIIQSPDSLSRLLGLLTSPDSGTRLWAATHCLAISPKEAESALEILGKKSRSFVAVSANAVLNEWKKGRLLL